jgi:NitT/TauT family transport system ATP-binding protein
MTDPPSANTADLPIPTRDGGVQPKVAMARVAKLFVTEKGDEVKAVDDFDMVIGSGEFVCLVGPSGCGKTTILRILAGLEHHTGGELRLLHHDPAKPLISVVFQEQSIFPWMTVRDNIAYGLRMRRVREKEVRETVDFYIDKIGLRKFATAYPFQLSGGMKQRVSVARAFANDPEILLMDEPFANLDEQNRVLLQEELLRIWGETNKTVLFVTHSIDEAVVLADRVVVMTAHPGTVKSEVSISFPRPRQVYELKANPEFGGLVHRVWGLLREEVMKAKATEVGL